MHHARTRGQYEVQALLVFMVREIPLSQLELTDIKLQLELGCLADRW